MQLRFAIALVWVSVYILFSFQSISIVDVINNVLDEDNQAGWEALQLNDVGSQALLNNAERYGLYVARATNETTDNISISRDNIGK